MATFSVRTELKLYFNFKCPYCYLLSKALPELLGDFDLEFVWRPLGGWHGRISPENEKAKIPLVRQDVARWCRRMGIPMKPPPATTNPTRAAAASLHAERVGRLTDYIAAAMHIEWGEGHDIGDVRVLAEVARRIGMEADVLLREADAPANLSRLTQYAAEAKTDGVVGVPSFVIEDEVFWGHDRLDFLRERLMQAEPARGAKA